MVKHIFYGKTYIGITYISCPFYFNFELQQKEFRFLKVKSIFLNREHQKKNIDKVAFKNVF
jgi:hypothetical protein